MYFTAERLRACEFPIILCCGEEAAGMRRKSPKCRRAVLRLRDLDHSKAAVLNSLGSAASRRAYQFAMDSFIEWYCSEPRLAFGRIVVTRFLMSLEARGLPSSSINQRLAAVRRLAYEAADCGLLSPELAAGIRGRNKEFIGSEMRSKLQALTTTTPQVSSTTHRKRLKSINIADILRHAPMPNAGRELPFVQFTSPGPAQEQ
jgi:hypothetical protein